MAGGIRQAIRVVFKERVEAQRRAERAADAVLRTLQAGAFRIERSAKRRAPVAFGVMRGSIHTRGPVIAGIRKAISFFVEVGALYAKFVEFGTGPAGRASADKSPESQLLRASIGYAHGAGSSKVPPLDAIEQWVKRKGLPRSAVWPIARKIARQGIPAQPFLIPAFREHKDRIAADVTRAAERALAEKP